MRINLVGAELFHGDGKTDRHNKANSPFGNFAKAPENQSSRISRTRENIGGTTTGWKYHRKEGRDDDDI